MTHYVITKDSIAIFRRLGEQIVSYVSEIWRETDGLLRDVVENGDLPNVNLQVLRDALETISREIEALEKPTGELSEKMLDIAEGYEEVFYSHHLI